MSRNVRGRQMRQRRVDRRGWIQIAYAALFTTVLLGCRGAGNTTTDGPGAPADLGLPNIGDMAQCQYTSCTSNGVTECVDTTASAGHCGACGNVCTTGPCVNSTCAPLPGNGVIFAVKPKALLLDSGWLYFLDHTFDPVTSSLRRVSVASGTAETLATGLVGARESLAISAGSVNWVSVNPTSLAGAVLRVPTTGGTPMKLVDEGFGTPIAADSTNVYFSGLASTQPRNPVLYQTSAAGVATPLFAFMTPPGPTGITTDGSFVYFTNNYVDPGANITGNSIVKLPVGGGSVQTVCTPVGTSLAAFLVYLNGQLVFSQSIGAGHCDLFAVPSTSVATAGMFCPGMVHITQTNADCPLMATSDGTSVFFGDATKKIYRVPLAGGAAVAIADWTPGQNPSGGIDGSTWIAVDDQKVYYTTYGASWSGIMSAAK